MGRILGKQGKIAVSLHKPGEKNGDDTLECVGVFLAPALANLLRVCYTDIVNMGKCPGM